MKDIIHIAICKMLFHHTREMFYPGYLKENREDSQSVITPLFHKKCHINSPHHDVTIKYDDVRITFVTSNQMCDATSDVMTS